MKFSVLFSLLVLASAFTTAVVSFNVDTAESQVTWKGYKVTGSHEGTIAVKDGNLDFTDGRLTGGSFTIDMTTIDVTDLTANQGKGKLEGHLKSADFFGVEKFPTATFRISRAVPKGTPNDYKIQGQLQIKEKIQPISFYANVQERGNRVVATADLQIDRTDFDVRYGSGSFFDNLGDKTIYDEFDLSIQLVANK